MTRTALITGASSGLGLEYAKLFAKDGYSLILVARSKDKLEALKDELEKEYGIEVFVCVKDLAKKDAAVEIFDFTCEKGKQVDILVNNAGFGDCGDFSSCNWDKQYEMVQVNVMALMQLTKCFLEPMLKNNKGKILNIASIAASCAGPYMSVYYASKAFVLSFSEAVAEEVKKSGITVTAFCPGPVDTGFEKAAGLEYSIMFKKLRASNAGNVALAGYKAMMKGRTVTYYGAKEKLLIVVCKLVPRSVSRKFAKIMNEIKRM